MIDSQLKKIQREIARIAKNEQEARALVSMLSQTDWQQIIAEDNEKRKVSCKKCGRRDKYENMRPLPIGSQNMYCHQCCVKCPVCQGMSIKNAHQWLYPLCRSCVEHISLDRSVLAREATKVKYQNTRAEKHGRAATLTMGQWIGTLLNFSWNCAYCTDTPYKHLDHFLPIALGGGTTQDNCVPACQSCNSLKSFIHPHSVNTLPQEAISRIETYLSQYR